MRLHGAHVVLTGATGSIGSRIAARLAERGARLTVTARSAPALEALAARVGGRPVVADLATADGPADLLRAAEAVHGPVDVLVHNAAVEVPGRLEDLGASTLSESVALNVRAPLELTRLALPGMRARGRGHVVLVSSLAGVATFPGLTLYGATKAALTQAASGLALDLRGSGVGTTVAEIGPVTSEMLRRARTHPPTDAAFVRAARLRVLRDLDPDEVARALVTAVERDRRHVRLPRRAAVLAATAGVPRAVVRVALTGVRG